MTGVRALHSVDRQHPNRVDAELVDVGDGGEVGGGHPRLFWFRVAACEGALVAIGPRWRGARLVLSAALGSLPKLEPVGSKVPPLSAPGGGFDGFLRKPFHVRQVIEAVEDAMAVVY